MRILDFSFDGGTETVTKWYSNWFPGLILGSFCTIFVGNLVQRDCEVEEVRSGFRIGARDCRDTCSVIVESVMDYPVVVKAVFCIFPGPTPPGGWSGLQFSEEAGIFGSIPARIRGLKYFLFAFWT